MAHHVFTDGPGSKEFSTMNLGMSAWAFDDFLRANGPGTQRLRMWTGEDLTPTPDLPNREDDLRRHG